MHSVPRFGDGIGKGLGTAAVKRRFGPGQHDPAAAFLVLHLVHGGTRQEERMVEVDVDILHPVVFGHAVPVPAEVNGPGQHHQRVDATRLIAEFIDHGDAVGLSGKGFLQGDDPVVFDAEVAGVAVGADNAIGPFQQHRHQGPTQTAAGAGNENTLAGFDAWHPARADEIACCCHG